jgi:hypothetical protein
MSLNPNPKSLAPNLVAVCCALRLHLGGSAKATVTILVTLTVMALVVPRRARADTVVFTYVGAPLVASSSNSPAVCPATMDPVTATVSYDTSTTSFSGILNFAGLSAPIDSSNFTFDVNKSTGQPSETAGADGPLTGDLISAFPGGSATCGDPNDNVTYVTSQYEVSSSGQPVGGDEIEPGCNFGGLSGGLYLCAFASSGPGTWTGAAPISGVALTLASSNSPPSSVMPVPFKAQKKGTTSTPDPIYVKATVIVRDDSGQLLNNAQVRFSADPDLTTAPSGVNGFQTAGHCHENYVELSSLVNTFSKSQSSPSKPQCTTKMGTCFVYWKVPEVSGNYMVTATLAADTTQSNSKPIIVGFTGLQPLGSAPADPCTADSGNGPGYVLTGENGNPGVTSDHYQNHYGLPLLLANVKNLALSFNLTTGQTLGINDMSLSEGGKFDILNNWYKTRTAHVLHRNGNSVDVDHNNPKLNLFLLDNLFVNLGMCPVLEPPNIHYDLQIQGCSKLPIAPAVSRSNANSGQALYNVSISADVDRAGTGLVYSYIVGNSGTSKGPIASVDVDVSGCKDCDAPSAQSQPSDNGFLSGLAVQASKNPSAVPRTPVGVSGPPNWVSTISVGGTVSWIAEGEVSYLLPGAFGSGFQVTSTGLPGIRTAIFEAYYDFDKLPLTAPQDLGDLQRYDDDLKNVLENYRVRVSTIGPVSLPKMFEPITFLRTVSRYEEQSRKLGWIKDQETAKEFAAKLGAAGTALAEGNKVWAASILTEIAQEASAQEGKTLTSEGTALLKFNCEYLANLLKAKS